MNIKSLREKKKFTQREIAQKVGISEHGYQLYECGLRIPNAEKAILIAKALGTTVEKLWGYK